MLNLAKASLLSAIVSTVFTTQQTALANRPSMRTPQHIKVINLMHQYWRCSEGLKPNTEPTLDFLVADNGFIYNPKISQYSGNEQHDAECLEALCDLSPIDCSSGRTYSSLMAERIIESFIPSGGAPEIAEYRKTHPDCRDSVILHKIPPSLARRFPEIISMDEVCSPENLYAVKVDITDHTEDKEGKRVTGEPRYAQAIRSINDHWKLHLFDYGSPPTKRLVQELASQVEAVSKR